MKKNILSAFVCTALAAFAFAPSALAVGADGDIRSIQAVPVDEYGATGNPNSPLTVGETLYVRVRLLNESWGDALVGSPHAWVFERNAKELPSDWKDVLYKPALAIAIGAKIVNAEFTWTGPGGVASGLNPANDFYTDLYFAYTVKEGELGLPIRFVNASGKIVDDVSQLGSGGFNLVNVNTANRTGGYWDLTNDLAAKKLASFWYGPAVPTPDPTDTRPYPGDGVGDTEHMNYDKIYPGVYVQTIDFVGTDGDVSAGVWRQVYQGLDDEVGKTLAIKGTGPTTVYVWSGDETVAIPEGTVDSTVTDRTVVKVTLSSSGDPVTFKLLGGTASVGKTCRIYLSSRNSFAKNADGTVLYDSAVARTVQLTAAPDPYITISRALDGVRSGITVEATTNYQNNVQMRVSFTKAYDLGPTTVALNPTVGGLPFDANATKFLKILTDANGDPTVDASVTEVTVPAGEKEAFFYVFPLGSDADLKSTGVTFTPTTDNSYFDASKKREAVVKVTDQKPLVVQAAPAASSAFQGDKVDVDVMLKDNWRDLQKTLNTAGYNVVIGLNGTKVCETNEVHFAEEDPLTFSVTVPLTAEGAIEGYVRVWDATHTRTSDYVERTFRLTVNKKPAYTATPYFYATMAADAPRIYPEEFCEGEAPVMRVVLSQIPTTDVYAFLVADDAKAPMTSMIVSTLASTTGLLISKENNANPTNSAATKLQLLDGDAVLPHLTKAKLKVVLKDGPDFATAKVVDTYECKSIAFDVTNAVPGIEKVYKGTAESGALIRNGSAYGGTLPSGSPVNFTAKVFDPGSLDLKDGAQPIRVKWVWTDGPAGDNPEQTPVKTDVSSAGYAVCPITFYQSGVEQTVSLYAQDRDMRAADPDEYGELLYTFKVRVGEQPHVVLSYPTGVTGGVYYESGNKKLNKINVKVSDYPAATDHSATDPAIGTAANPLKVRLTVDNEYHSDAGVLKLVDPKTSEVADSVVVEFVKSADNTAGKDVWFDLVTQNGGADGPSMFMIRAEVINTEKNQYDTPWSEYFFSTEAEADMWNVDPTVKLEPGDATHSFGETNTWTAGEVVTLKWTAGDILRDLKSGSFKVTWTLTDTDGKLFKTVDPATVSGSTASGTASGTYTFKVPDATLTEVTVTADDGDGGTAKKVFYIKVVATKKIAINVFGPAEMTETKYDVAAGLGRGHVYVEDSTGQYLARNFKQTWNYNESMKQAHVFAAGYPSAEGDAFDNGKIDAGYTGAALTPTGGKWESGAYYNYGNSTFDNFFYRWATIGAGEGDSSSVTLLAPNPTKSPSVVVDKYFELDNENDKDSTAGYATVQIEAIFAQEFLASDNMGDINADGVPDLYAKKYTGLGVFDENGAVTGNDLEDLSKSNVDEDYYPNTMSASYASFVPGLAETWVMKGRAFTARDEIRGVDENLNDAPHQILNDGTVNLVPVKGVEPDLHYSDPTVEPEKSTLSLLEYIAFTNWCGRQETPLDPTNSASWRLWTPERPTDPTVADTDGDDLPDGYEYYWWYKAHVGYFEKEDDPTTWKRLTGRKYNPPDPCHPIEISADEIEALYDPLVKNKDVAELDTDNDGLTDLVEFTIGTNPFDYDTDGDGLPDGYEVAISKTDPLMFATDGEHGDQTLNADADVMAMTELVMYPVMFEETEGETTVTNTLWAMEGVTVADGKLAADVKLYDAWQYTMEGQLALGRFRRNAPAETPVVGVGEPATVWALHYQVYTLLGFDPRTAWTVTPAIMRNAVKFTNWDEFMLMAWFVHTGGLAEADTWASEQNSHVKIWTTNSTNPLNPDTDGDLMPDGWELYVMGGPGVMEGIKPGDAYSPLKAIGGATKVRDFDEDGLEWPEEYSGTQSSAVHGWTPLYPKWRNKAWPTNPWNPDTDGDGMLDGVEGGVVNELVPLVPDAWEANVVRRNFLYNSAGKAGGGLNPLSVDTDLDGLPDPWETQFHGSYTAGSSTVTDTTSVYAGQTNVTSAAVTAGVRWNMDGMDGTVSDARLDYDSDGVANWQEYMVGAMRCWRYDDTESRWESNAESLSAIFGLAPNSAEWNEFWSSRLLDRDGADFNPHLVNGSFDPGQSYFSCVKNDFDPAVGEWYMYRDGIDHDLRNDGFLNRFFGRAVFAPWKNGCPYDTGACYPQQYISCDPRESDSDHDGMDDYYELFHGLNPLLGEPGVQSMDSAGEKQPCDIVYNAYLNPPMTVTISGAGEVITAINNWWRNDDTKHPTTRGRTEQVKKFSTSWDFIAYPWLNGIAGADPDGDNIGNQEEAIMPNVQAASTYHHTDPTPLWMTDSSYADSLTRRYYRLSTQPYDEDASAWMWMLDNDEFTDEKGNVYHLGDFDGFEWDAAFGILYFSYDLNIWGVAGGWAYSFEENEGYDSDHDFLSDFEEGQGKTKNASDPQDSDDPLRRQAMYFNGVDAFLQTPISEAEQVVNESVASEARQNFLYYTVECWAKADAESLEGQALRTLVERAIWTGPANAADERYLRKNFVIGVKNGRWYTRFDTTGSDDEKYVEITDGPQATTDWTHVAATYDGTALRLYVNGVCNNIHTTSVQPEHGVNALAINAAGEMHPDGGTLRHGDYVTLLVGASAKTKHGIVYDWAWRNRYYTQVTAENPYGLASQTTFSDYGNFYKGYVDEVRVWDGARSDADLLSDYENRLRYTTKEVNANREAVWSKWRLGALRSPVSAEQLPPQLMYHFSFDHLTGAVLTNDVRKVPAGFDTAKTVKDAAAMWSRPDGWTESCWNNTAVRSKVYTDTAWVPWINNTVAHLPRIDLTTLDSFYWSDDYAGATPAGDYGYASFAFPRTHEVFSRWTQVAYLIDGYYDSHYDPDFTLWNQDPPLMLQPIGVWLLSSGFTQKTRFDALFEYQDTTNGVVLTGEKADMLLRMRFASRDRNVVGDDLLPMGGAYPRRISAAEGGMWDNRSGNAATASDAWAQTGADSDNNGLPDWWEEYARARYAKNLRPRDPLTWDTTVTYSNGATMPAWQAYLRDLAKGLVKIGDTIEIKKEYEDGRDYDQDGLPDWWEELYGLDATVSNADDDPDNDGLSNYHEYLLQERYPTDYKLSTFGIDVGMLKLNPGLARSTPGQKVPDYFLRYTNEHVAAFGDSHFRLNEYFGEIVTDHDFMEDWWEKAAGSSYADTKVYDPLDDKDQDGWSNWAECRASLWGGYFSAELIDKWTGSDSTQHVNCYPEPIIGVKVTYNGARDLSGQQLVVQTTSGQTPRMDAVFIVPASVATQTRYIGAFNADSKLHGHMSPGMVNASTIIFECVKMGSDKVYNWSWAWYEENDDLYARNYSGEKSGTFERYQELWQMFPHLQLVDADLIWEVLCDSVPSTDMNSATLIIDGATQFGTVNCITGEYELDMSKFSKAGGAKQYAYRVTYTTRVGHEWPQTVYLSDTQELAVSTTGESGTQTVGHGRVREGKNTIEAFMDLNANGALDVGEPYGSVRNVQVGWHKVPTVVIELKDDSPVMPCLSVGSAEAAGNAGSNVTSVASQITKTVRVVRERINDTETARTLFSKTVVLDDRPYLTEADAGSLTKPDLDWVWLNKDAERRGIESVDSAVYSVYEYDSNAHSNTALLATFTKEFSATRPTAMAVEPKDGQPVYKSSPTLSFTASDTKATAYRLQIRRTNDTETVLVYDSDVAILPGRVGSTVGVATYEVTPPVYADAPVYTGKTLTGHPTFADGATYQWRVALGNAKFSDLKTLADDSEAWGSWATFQMDLANTNRNPQLSTGYGTAKVVVRYFGPTNCPPANIVVEAYENADFRGQALAQARVTDDGRLSDATDLTTANAVLRGLKPTRLFFRAFYDQNTNGVRDVWETWGYANQVGKGNKCLYNPAYVDMTTTVGDWKVESAPSVTIFMEDCDVNKNEKPDCIEPEKFKDTTSADESDPTDWWDWAEADPTDAADGDVMAYYETTMYLVTLTDDITKRDSPTYGPYLIEADRLPVSGTVITNGAKLATCYEYGSSLYGYGLPVTNLIGRQVYGTAKEVSVVYVHSQVREKFGFSSDTAVPGGKTNTKAFTAQDKYLVLRYLEKTGRIPTDLVAVAEKAGSKTFEDYVYSSGNEKLYEKYTLRPSLVDSDYDGIADGWELYVDSDPLNASDRNSDADGDGVALWREYDWEIETGTAHPTDPNSIDSDGDGVLDSYYHDYLLWDAGGDRDGDGLPNYTEYLITEVFKYAVCDPMKYATNDGVCDYFKKVGDLYLGEIFTDHDQMDDKTEAEIGFNRYVYDADKDLDGNGWSNYAEYKARLNDNWSETGATSNSVVKTFDYGSAELAQFEQTTNRLTVTKTLYWDDVLQGWTATPDKDWAYTKIQYTILQETKISSVVPSVTVKVTYNGTQSVGSYVVKAWKDASMATAPDAVWTVLGSDAVETAGNTKTFVLDSTYSGALKEGLNAFVVYAQTDTGSTDSTGSGDTGSAATTIGEYAAGAPYGFVRDVNVGWNAAEFAVELTDVSPVFARIDITTGDNDRQVKWGSASGNVETEEYMERLTNSVYHTEIPSEAQLGKVNHVRIIPFLVGGTATDTALTEDERTYAEVVMGAENRVIAEFDVDTENRAFITEADFIKNGEYDIQWNDFPAMAEEIRLSGVDVGSITAVKYRIIIGNGGRIGAESNLDDTEPVVSAFSTLIERRFEAVRTKPSALEVQGGGIVYGGRPTFIWRLDESTSSGSGSAASAATFGCSYTAFQIQVADANNQVVWDSGLQRTPVKDATGRFVWTAPLVAGQQTAVPAIFKKAGNWKWRVAMYNAKFQPKTRESENGWSTLWKDAKCATFSTAVGQQQETDDHGYGSVNVAVKYAGPVKVLADCQNLASLTGKVRVQAFSTPDFSGAPEAEVTVTNKVAVTNALDVTANATLAGLRNGATYYVRAYIDSDGDFKKAAWESWGEAKAGVEIAANKAAETVAVWIEDADTDGDWLPDAWEYVTPGYTVGSSDASVDPQGKIVYSTTYNDITDGKANISTTLSGSSLTFFENLDAAALLLGFGSDKKTDTIAAIRAAVEKKIDPQTVKVSSLVVDAKNKQVVLTVEADVADSIAGYLLSPVYTLPKTATVYIDIYRKASLVDTNWEKVGTYSREVSTALDAKITVPVEEDLTSGFYRVEVRQ